MARRALVRLLTRRQPPHHGPLLLWTIAAAAGCLVGGGLPSHAAVAASALGLAVAVGAAVPSALSSTRWRGIAGAVAATAVVAGITGVRVAALQAGPLHALARQGGVASVSAIVVTEPQDAGFGGWTVVVRVDRVDDVTTRERATLRGSGERPALGTPWHGRATARPLRPDDGYDRHLGRQHVVAHLDARSWEPGGRAGALARSSEWLRERIRVAAAGSLPDGAAGLAVGLVTGDTSLLPEADDAAMVATGLSHLTAVSGSNVAIVVTAALLACAAVRLGAKGRRVAVAVTVAWFAYLTRFEPSVLRAGVMAGVVTVATARGVPRDPRYALAAALLLLVLVDPMVVTSVGLLLSATAAGGVLLVAPLVRRRLQWLRGRAGDLVAVTVGAQVAVAPVLLLTFGEVPLAAIPANVVAVPAAAVASLLAGTGAVVAAAHPRLAAPLMTLAGPPLAVVLGVARSLQSWGGTVSWQRPATVAAAAAVATWLVARPRSAVGRRAIGLLVVALVAVVVPLARARLPVDTFVVTAIDVGQGDAILLETPAARVLVDTGRDDRAARWLRSAGRRDLDLLVVSHFDADHSGGAVDVLTQGDVAALWVSLVPAKEDSAAAVLDVAAERGIPVHAPVAGQRAVVGDLSLEVLGPAAGRPYRYLDDEPNEASLVLRATWQDRAVLLTGDAERHAQADLLSQPQRLVASVLKVPHHGAGDADPRFITATGAHVALVSVGRDNRYGHPHPDTLTRLSAAGMAVRRTDEDGTIRLAVPPAP